MIHVRELLPDDAPAVARIEAALHDRSLADGELAHRRHLGDAHAAGVNMSFGAYAGDRLVGYVLCFGFEPTAFPEEQGHAIYIEDIAVEPKHRAALPRLLKRFVRETQASFPGVPIEAHALECVSETWNKHMPLFARAGFELERHSPTQEIMAGQRRYAFRWKSPARVAAGLDEVLERLHTHSIELDGRPYAVKLVRSETDWDALSRVWDELLLATPEHTVFQSFKYQRLWWRHFGGDSELLIVVLISGTDVVGIAPLRTFVAELYGRYRRHLAFIGSRWEVDRPTFLFGRDGRELTRVLVRFLAGQTGRWEVCELYEQPSGSAMLNVLIEEFRRAGLLVGTARDSDCPYLSLGGSWPALLAAKSQKFRKNLKSARRRLEQIGRVRYATYDSLPAVGEQLERYRELEARSWKQAEQVGVSRNDDYFTFYREMAAAFGEGGQFLIRMLRVDDRDVAGTFGLVFDGVFYSLQIVHDHEFDRCSPGTYLESLEIEECFARGYREYELLGGFLSNKARWTSTYRYTTSLFVYRRTPAMALRHWATFKAKPRVKELIRPFMKSWPKRPAAP